MLTRLPVATALAGTLLSTCLVSGSAQATSVPVLKGDATPGIVTLVGRGGGGMAAAVTAVTVAGVTMAVTVAGGTMAVMVAGGTMAVMVAGGTMAVTVAGVTMAVASTTATATAGMASPTDITAAGAAGCIARQ